MQDKVIQGKTCTITNFSALEGWKVGRRLLKVVGPSFGVLSDSDKVNGDAFKDAIELFFKNCSEKEMVELLTKLSSVALIEGRKINPALDLPLNKFTFELLGAVLEVNFSDFFSPIKEMVSDLQAPTQEAVSHTRTTA